MRKILLLAAISILLYGCPEKTVVSPVDKGSIRGRVMKYFEYGLPERDNSGVEVRIKGTENKVISDDDGYFIFEGVEPGVYDFVLSFPEYDSTEIFAYNFPGNGPAWLSGNESHVKILQRSRVELSNLTGTLTDDTLKLNFKKDNTIYADGVEYFHYRIFMSTSADVSKDNFIYTVTDSVYDTRLEQTDICNKNIPLTELLAVFKGGDEVFIKVYPGISLLNADYRTGYRRYSGLGIDASNTVSVTIPD